ncbi:hypothetical protein [Streptomyces sp. NBC_00582]|uniref:hypothetical protein n=1 Tax=Streptomyces sp. NBC_00582 TaxID=2975783 RepID=UPI002E7FED4A|nr:hypothetical protein [Streptomyces sp. NBC_00582]WUB64400.1 hypothetical protein OG852_30430 [Streptomyces sp. NBC_00582]
MTATPGPARPSQDLRADYDLSALGAAIVRSSKKPSARVAAQALADERTILALPPVQAALIVQERGKPVAVWERLMGRLYTLPLDSEQRAFLGLVLSMLSIGSTPLAAASDLSGERLRIITQAVLRLADDDSIAIGTRI